jgi:hypothetical protein
MNVQHLKVSYIDQVDAKAKAAYPPVMTDREKYDQINSISKSTGRPFQKYYIEFKTFYTSQSIQSDCNEITFINTGTTNVSIESVLLYPNQSLRIGGSINEIDTTEYSIFFATVISTGNSLTVLRKLYK